MFVLLQDRERLLVELEHLQQTDLLRRRQQVSQMPPQIFQPLYKRQETREDFQREMEFAFEDMYTGERRKDRPVCHLTLKMNLIRGQLCVYRIFLNLKEKPQHIDYSFKITSLNVMRLTLGVKGDLVVQLVPEPLPAASTGSRDQELDVTLDETSRPEAEHVPNDTEREAGSSEQETSAEGKINKENNLFFF